MDPQSSWERATMANGIQEREIKDRIDHAWKSLVPVIVISLYQSDMAELTKKYLKKLYYKERFEVINKGISTITAIWIICFLDYSKTITCLLVLATIVTNVLLYGYSNQSLVILQHIQAKRCFRLIFLLGFRPHFQVTSKMPNRYDSDL